MEHPRKQLVLVAMIFAVAMTFIDQTIVAIAAPELQKDLELSENGVQWIVNGYLLALSAPFAFGGRLSDIVGHRRMVVGADVPGRARDRDRVLPPCTSAGARWRSSSP